MKHDTRQLVTGYVLALIISWPVSLAAADVPAWLSGPAITEVPECLQDFFDKVKEDARVERAGIYRSLAKKRLANLVVRAWRDRRTEGAETYEATLRYLYTESDGAPYHYRFHFTAEEIDRLGSDC